MLDALTYVKKELKDSSSLLGRVLVEASSRLPP